METILIRCKSCAKIIEGAGEFCSSNCSIRYCDDILFSYELYNYHEFNNSCEESAKFWGGVNCVQE